MTKDKAQKQAIRSRMAKTGERYTTARHFLLDLHHQARHANDDPDAAPSDEGQPYYPEGMTPALAAAAVELAEPNPRPAPSLAAPALPSRVAKPGMSDAAVLRGAGRRWDEWFALLDAWGASTRTHPEIARRLYDTYGIDGWWAQGVTIGYERARGMRAMHERPDGFSVNASKTFPVPVERLFAAFMDAQERVRWMAGVELRSRTSQPNRSARFDILPGETRLAVTFIARGAEKAVAQLQQERLPSAEEVERWRVLWKDQLARLATYLAEEPPTP